MEYDAEACTSNGLPPMSRAQKRSIGAGVAPELTISIRG
jgi:hypothetical protein